MSQYTDTVHSLGSTGYPSAQNSVDRWVGLSNLSRYLLGSSTLSELLERASCSIVEILGIDYVRIMTKETNGHFYYRSTYLKGIGSIKGSEKSPVPDIAETVLQQITQAKPALMPCLVDSKLSLDEHLAFFEGEYKYIWIVSLSVDSQEIGFLEFGKRNAKEGDLYLINSTQLVELIAGQLSNAIFRIKLNDRLSTTSVEMVKALTKALEVRDSDSGSHCQNIANLAKQLARKMGCTEPESLNIYWAALLHDIGKIGVEDKILRKPAKLNEDEWQIIKKHPEIGAKIVQGLTGLNEVAPLILCHHEHMDGSGYPKGLKGDQIPLGARIISVVDSFSAIVEGRVYQPKRAIHEAIETLIQQKGTQFDPLIVDTFIQMIKERDFII
jgi:putative nucleotidyltransferase with HDIG domain